MDYDTQLAGEIALQKARDFPDANKAGRARYFPDTDIRIPSSWATFGEGQMYGRHKNPVRAALKSRRDTAKYYRRARKTHWEYLASGKPHLIRAAKQADRQAKDVIRRNLGLPEKKVKKSRGSSAKDAAKNRVKGYRRAGIEIGSKRHRKIESKLMGNDELYEKMKSGMSYKEAMASLKKAQYKKIGGGKSRLIPSRHKRDKSAEEIFNAWRNKRPANRGLDDFFSKFEKPVKKARFTSAGIRVPSTMTKKQFAAQSSFLARGNTLSGKKLSRVDAERAARWNTARMLRNDRRIARVFV